MNGHITFIKAVLEQAKKEHVIDYNSCDAIRKFKEAPKEPEFFSIEEIMYIFSCLKEEKDLEQVVLTTLLIFTGAGCGEVAGLRWKYVDFEAGELFFCNKIQYIAYEGTSDGALKNRINRRVSIEPEILDLLKEWKDYQDELKLRAGDNGNDKGYVFNGTDGGCINPDAPRKWLDAFSKRHSLPHIHPHMFRHSHASILIACGEDISTISRRLGHTSISTTAKIYVHAFEKGDRTASRMFTEAVLNRDLLSGLKENRLPLTVSDCTG